ncbi:hypothetical protein R6258_07900 [Halomonas sp. HP20-15]|uniref:hypothetical protein n=1 Tax=Halomonas sp. HP20-15 TaxID=3085901 RepID=UPI00298209F3|nr:hypothetical protein [Halomonas sp. HP20-15]MDW5376843.1 hypothetical protein [Halomonas sp. HP20-15]
MQEIEQSGRDAAAGIATIVTAAAAAGAGVLAYSNMAAQSARELKNQAQIANTTVEEMQRMGYACATVGVQQEKLGDILKDVNDRVGDFMNTGGGEMADFFEKIAPKVGITAEQFRNLSGPQALQLYFDGLQKANLSQAELTFYMESISDEATALIPLLRNGGAGFAELGAEADALGIVLTDVQANALTDFAHDFDRVTGIMKGSADVAVAELAPAMSELADELVGVAEAWRSGEYGSQIEVLSTAATVAGGAATAYAAYRGAVAAAAVAQWAFNAAASANPIGALITVLGAAGGALYAYREELGLTEDKAGDARDEIDLLTGSVEDLTAAQLENKKVPLVAMLVQTQLEAAKTKAQLDTVAEAIRESGQLDEFGGARPVATADDMARGRELTAQLEEQRAVIQASQDELGTLDEMIATFGSSRAGDSGGGGGSGGDDAADAIRKQIAALEQQAATVGMTAEQETLYKLATEGATGAQIAQARASLQVVSAYEEQQKASEDYQSLVAGLRTDEEQLNHQLLERLDILDAVKLSTEEYQEMAARVADAGFKDAPEYGGLDAEVGGAFGELAKIDEAEEKLQEWYDTQLEMLEQYREERTDLTSQWDEQERQLKREHEDELARIEQSRQMAQLVAAESVFGDLTAMAQNFAGEQSGIYQAMFAVQKAAAIAQSVVAIQQGIALAAANPWPMNLAAMASVAAATAGIVSNISAITMAGQAHDGIMSVPEDGTWNLKKGERVTTAETSAKLDRTLDDVAKTQQPAAAGNQAPIVNLNEDASRAGQVSSRQQDDGRWVLDLVVSNIMGDGQVHKALTGKYPLKTRGR